MSPILVEYLTIAALLVGGGAFLRAVNVRGWVLPALALIVGIAVQAAVGLVQVVAGLPTYPAITLGLTVALPVGWLVWRIRRGDDLGPLRPTIAGYATGLGVAVAVIVLRLANLVKWHTDSLTYMITSDLLAHNTYRTGVSTHFLTGRMLGLPLLHAPANAANDTYLRAVTPLLAVATLALLVWLLRTGLPRVPGRVLALFGALGALLLLTNNRFVFSVFYLNGHLELAAMTLLIAGCGWLLAAGRGQTEALRALQLVAIPALVLIRPEGTLAAALALLPTLLTRDIPVRHRAALLATLGATTVAWQGFEAWVFIDRGYPVPASVLGVLALGVALVAAIALLHWNALTARSRELLWLVEAVLWLALAALAVRKPAVLVDSVKATYANLVQGKGGWGLSLVVLGLLFVAALVLFRTRHQAYLRFPVTTFVPLAFVLAYLREGAYREGFGDSLTRMFMHIVPLAVLALLVAVTSHTGPSTTDTDTDDTTTDNANTDNANANTDNQAETGMVPAPAA